MSPTSEVSVHVSLIAVIEEAGGVLSDCSR